jgi:hypothetical protein
VSFFVLGAFTASKPDIYEAVTLVRKESAGEEEPAEGSPDEAA